METTRKRGNITEKKKKKSHKAQNNIKSKKVINEQDKG